MSKISKSGTNIPQLRFPEFKAEDEWEENNIGKISKNVTAGGTPSTLKKEYWGGNIRWMNSGELNNKKIFEVQGRITKEGLKNSSTKLIPENCILIGLAGQGKTRGTVAINRVELCMNQSIAAIYPNKKIFNSDFLYHNLDNRYKELRNLSAGSDGRGGLNLTLIKSISIYLPSIEEQKKIADCLISIDNLILSSSKKVEALKEHKKGLMQQLFPKEGENVPKLRFPEFKNTEVWQEKQLKNIISYFKGFAFKSKDYKAKGRRIVRVSDMGFDYIKKEEKAIYIDEKEAIQYEKWELKKEDSIVTTVGSKPPMYDSLVGRAIVVKSENERSLLNQNAVCLRAINNIEQRFLNTLFKRNEYIKYVESIIRGNANQGSITLENLFQYKVYIPNFEEQKKIADFILSIDNLIEEQTKKVEALKKHKKGLMQQLFPSSETYR